MSAAAGWRQHAVVAVALAAVVAAAYGNSLQGGFPYDNRAQILEDARLHAATAENVRRLFTEDHWWPRAVSGLYRPLTKLTFLVNYAVLGNADRPLGYHLVNLALHLLNAFLVYRLALDIGLRLLPAACAAAFFAAHPVATEAVTNLVGRADQLAALVVLGGWLLYRGLQTRPGVWRLIALAAVTTFGVLAKENAAILPGMMLLSDVVFRRRPRAAGYAAVLLPIVAVWLWRRQLYASLPAVDLPFVDNPLVGADFWTQRLTALAVLTRSVALLAWPATLSSDYAYRQIPLAGGSDPLALAGLALVALLAGLAVLLWRRAPAASFLIGFFFVAWLPTSNLMFPIGSIMAERFLYLALVAFCAGLAWALSLALARPLPLAAVASGIVIAYGARTALRNRDWQDALQLWSSAAAAAPESFRAHQSLALALYHTNKDLDGAIAEGERARDILAGLSAEQTDSTTLYELGRFYMLKAERSAGSERAQWNERAAAVLGEAAAANRARSAALRARAEASGRPPQDIVDVGNNRIFYHYAMVLMALGRPQEAIGPLRWACHLTSSEAVPYNALARAYLQTGAADDAARVLLQAMEIEPGNRETLTLFAHTVRAIPDASCALRNVGGGVALDPSCPWLANQVCRARRELAEQLRAQDPARAEALNAAASSCS